MAMIVAMKHLHDLKGVSECIIDDRHKTLNLLSGKRSLRGSGHLTTLITPNVRLC